ncbi:MAG: tetratricopeptide repeat protein [bacterium]
MKEQLEEKNTEMGNVITRSEEFIQKNQKKIIIVVCAIVAVALIIFCWFRFYKQPRELKASEAIFAAENYFAAGDYQKALDGDAVTPGLLSVIDNYGSTKAGNVAKYYAGIANLRLGNYEAASKYLDSYSGKDLYTKPLALMARGDAEMEMGNTQAAVKLYVKAAETNTNELTTPTALFKAGMGYLILGDNTKALENFKKVKSDYPRSTEWPEIDKYIGLAEAK